MARLIALLLFGTLAVGGTAGIYYYFSADEDQQTAAIQGSGNQSNSGQQTTGSQTTEAPSSGTGSTASSGSSTGGSSSGGGSSTSSAETTRTDTQNAAASSSQEASQTSGANTASSGSSSSASSDQNQQETAAVSTSNSSLGSGSTTSSTTDSAAASRSVPSFDVVRIEKDGSTVMAGRAAPGAEVEITLNGEKLGQVTANQQGEWVFLPDQPLPAGDHELSLSGTVAGGEQVLSENVLVVAVPKSSSVQELANKAEELVTDSKEAVAGAASALTNDSSESSSASGSQGTDISSSDRASTSAEETTDTASAALTSSAGTGGGTEGQSQDSQNTTDSSSAYGSGSTDGQTSASQQQVAQAGTDAAETTQENNAAAAAGTMSNKNAVNTSGSGSDSNTQQTTETADSSNSPASTAGASTSEQTSQDGKDNQTSNEVVAVLVPREGGGSTKVLQGPETGLASGNLILDSITYDDAGVVSFAGRVDGGGTIFVYVDNALAAKATGQAGIWQAKGDRPVALGLHRLRVDQVAEDGSVLARVETPFARTNLLTLPAEQDRMVVVQPGNSLWRIARRVYGQGISYSVVFEANKDQIADPHLIYPGQIFVVPDKS